MNGINTAWKSDFSKYLGIAIPIIVSLFAYWYVTLLIVPGNTAPGSAPLVLSAVVSLAFWSLILFAVLGIMLRNVTMVFARTMRDRLWAKVLFPAYLSVHLVVYGLVLEKILVSVFGRPSFSVRQAIFFQAGGAFYPHTLFNALIQLTLNPSLVIILAPFYGIELTLFSFCSAIIIASLIVVHIERLSRNAKFIKRAGGSVIYPLIGVLGGASCCISLPSIFLDFTPLASSILLVPMWVDLLNVLYYLLPISVIVVLAAGLKPLSFADSPASGRQFPDGK